jgi:uncharacterized membrane protein
MHAQINNPLVVFVIALIAQSIAVYVGNFFRKRSQQFRQDERHDFDTVRATTMTLLALIIGFSFSMAVSRYDQRKSLEEAEATAIATEYVRAAVLPDELGGQVDGRR